jgi:hypothetical protein
MMNFNGLKIMQDQSKSHLLKCCEITLSDYQGKVTATKVAAAYLPMSKARGIRSFFGEQAKSQKLINRLNFYINRTWRSKSYKLLVFYLKQLTATRAIELAVTWSDRGMSTYWTLGCNDAAPHPPLECKYGDYGCNDRERHQDKKGVNQPAQPKIAQAPDDQKYGKPESQTSPSIAIITAATKCIESHD